MSTPDFIIDILTSVSSLFTINIDNGGLAGSVYGYLIVWMGTLAAFSTMAELSSM